MSTAPDVFDAFAQPGSHNPETIIISKTDLHLVNGTHSTRELALGAIRKGQGLVDEVRARGTQPCPLSYRQTLQEGRVLPPLDHEDPAHCLISGTGLTHLGSASSRDKMHQQNISDQAATAHPGLYSR